VCISKDGCVATITARNDEYLKGRVDYRLSMWLPCWTRAPFWVVVCVCAVGDLYSLNQCAHTCPIHPPGATSYVQASPLGGPFTCLVLFHTELAS
jgi:hypothetical protein